MPSGTNCVHENQTDARQEQLSNHKKSYTTAIVSTQHSRESLRGFATPGSGSANAVIREDTKDWQRSPIASTAWHCDTKGPVVL